MKITTAWYMDDNGNPCLISAYDELTFDAWGKVPDFHAVEMAKVRADGETVLEFEIEIPSEVIYDAFDTPTVQGSVSRLRAGGVTEEPVERQEVYTVQWGGPDWELIEGA